MFKIGEFSKIAQVSIRLLRYYDQIDLLKPAHIDAKSGYRYYTADQIPRLNRILALKNLGLSLEQIGQLLDDHISPQEIRGMLILKKKQLEQTIAEETIRLNLVESRLKELEIEGELSAYAPVLKTIPEQRFLAHREVTASIADMGSLIFSSIRALVAQQGQATVSAAVFYDQHFAIETIDWACGFLVNDEKHLKLTLQDGRNLQHTTLPAVNEMITVVHHGNWFDLHRGYSALGRWMSQHRYQFAGFAREVFLHIAPQGEPENHITEVQFPVKPLP